MYISYISKSSVISLWSGQRVGQIIELITQEATIEVKYEGSFFQF
jgi:hypothetical protein